MKVSVLAAGTRGDVEPFVALAQGLSRAGHEARLAAPAAFSDLASRHGVDFSPIGVDYHAVMESEEARAMLRNPLHAARHWRGLVLPMMRTILEDSWAAAQGATTIVFHPKTLGGSDIAEALGARCFLASPLPLLTPTGAFPAPGVVSRPLGMALNRLTYAATRGIVLPFAGVLNRWRRKTLGLQPRPLLARPFRGDGEPIPVLYGFSPLVVPRPGDWPASAQITGYWPLDEPGWTPPDDLVSFLDAGPPPVYVGFGSMLGQDPARTTSVILDGLSRSGQRAVVCTGWGGLDPGQSSESVYVATQAPHRWLFPRMSSVVHHGGAGTTAAGLRAGKPALVCPFFGDQHFWARRIHSLGAGPEPIAQKRLTAPSLADAIQAIATGGRFRRSAGAIAAQLAMEDGVGRAVELIEQ